MNPTELETFPTMKVECPHPRRQSRVPSYLSGLWYYKAVQERLADVKRCVTKDEVQEQPILKKACGPNNRAKYGSIVAFTVSDGCQQNRVVVDALKDIECNLRSSPVDVACWEISQSRSTCCVANTKPRKDATACSTGKRNTHVINT